MSRGDCISTLGRLPGTNGPTSYYSAPSRLSRRSFPVGLPDPEHHGRRRQPAGRLSHESTAAEASETELFNCARFRRRARAVCRGRGDIPGAMRRFLPRERTQPRAAYRTVAETPAALIGHRRRTAPTATRSGARTTARRRAHLVPRELRHRNAKATPGRAPRARGVAPPGSSSSGPCRRRAPRCA